MAARVPDTAAPPESRPTDDERILNVQRARRLSGHRRRAIREWALVTGGFFLLASVLTWPLLIKMSSGFYGFGNDNFGGIWQYEWLHRAAFGPGKALFDPFVQAPWGLQLDDRVIAPYDRLFAIFLGGIADGLFAYNIQIFLSFVLTGVTMYALGRYLTGSRLAAALGAVILVASPFHMAMAMQYPAMASMQWCPLLILAVIVALRRRTLMSAAAAGAAFALLWMTSYYYGWFAIWVLLAVLIAAGIRGIVSGARHRALLTTVGEGVRFCVTRGGVALLTFMCLVAFPLHTLASHVSSNEQQYSRTFDDVYFSSPKIWQYLLPPHDNPLLGRFTRDAINRNLGLAPNYEQALYLGIVPVLLALVAIVLWRRPGARARYARPLLLVAAIVAALMSLGPFLPLNPLSVDAWRAPGAHGHIKNLTAYLYELSPSFRFYGRAVVFVLISLAALAAVGLALLLPRLRRWGAAVPLIATVVLGGLVLVDFANRPPSRWVALPTAPWMKAVSHLPRGTSIVDYPVAVGYTPRSLYYMYTQPKHGHATLNPGMTLRAQALTNAVTDPDAYLAGQRLYDAGIDYAVIHTELPPATFPPYQPRFPNDSMSRDAGSRNPWFRRLETTPDAVIYRIVRPASIGSRVFAEYGANFGGSEKENGREWRWLLSDRGTVAVTVTGSRTRSVTLGLTVNSFAESRRLALAVDGRPVRTTTVAGDVETRLRLPLRLRPGTHTIDLETTPGAKTIDTVLRNGDRRTVSIRLQRPALLTGAAARGATPSASSRLPGRGPHAGYGDGFGAKELDNGTEWRWMTSGDGTILAQGARRTRGTLIFSARAFAVPRTVRILVPGTPPITTRVPADRIVSVRVPLPGGVNARTVRVSAVPGPQLIDDVLHNGDHRRVTIRVQAPRVALRGRG
jgi:hypothetical protein